MRRKRQLLSILVVLSMLTVLLVPMVGPAFAATDNYAITVPKVQNDTDGVILGTLVLKEDEDTDGVFNPGDVVTVTLPEGVEYSTVATQATKDQYVDIDDAGMSVTLKAYAENYISFEISGSNTAGEHKIYVYFGEDGRTSTVDLDGDVTGDIQVEIDAAGTSITSEYVPVARVVEGNTTTTISDVKTLPIDGSGAIATIKISENATGVLKSNTDYIELVLPNDYEWDVEAGDITAANLGAAYVDGDGEDTLRIQVTSASTTQPGFISISGASIVTPDDADDGDEVEMTVQGNEVTEQDIIIAKVGDFGFKLSIDGDLETIVAGKNDQEIPTIVVDDTVSGSWIQGRTVKLVLPSWAEWENTSTDGPLATASVNDDADELKYTVGAGTGKAELENMTVNIDADAPAGDLVVTFEGSAGVEGELVIAKIVEPFKVTADKPEITVGAQNQKLGDITLTETVDGAIDEGTWVVFEAPSGMSFADTPDVEVTEGDIDIDDEDVDEEFFAFRVTGESGKSASTIKISDITFDVDRTIPAGDVNFKVYMVAEDVDDDSNVDIEDVNDIADYDEDLEEVTKVAVGQVVTPPPSDVKNKAVFTIGQITYTLNGVEQTMDVAPYIKNDRTYMPLRYVAYAAGVADDNIIWNADEQSVVLIKGDRVVKLVIGSNILLINGVAFTMDVAPEITSDRTMLPVRWIAQALGCDVQWDEATQTVTIN